MTASHSVVKRTNKSVKVKGFQQIGPRTGTREFRSTLSGQKNPQPTAPFLPHQLSRTETTILVQNALNHTLLSLENLLLSIPVLPPVFWDILIKRLVFQNRGVSNALEQ